MHFRPVEVLRRERETVVIGGGLAAGEAVVVSPLAAVVEGMAVRFEDEPAETVGSHGEDPVAAPPAAAERS
jgi:multidrug efflux pump subunit AcrA (membrane-fusion protein)